MALALCALPLALLVNESTLPLTPEKMSEYVLSAKKNVECRQEEIVAVLPFERNYETTMRPWNRLGDEILLNFSILTYLAQGNFHIAQQAYQSIQELQGCLYHSLILNPVLQNTFLCYAEKALHPDSSANAYENFIASAILDSFGMIKPAMPSDAQDYLDHLQGAYASVEKTPFLYKKGLSLEKNLSAEEAKYQFTVLNLNTCFLPGELAFVHGGVALWQDRVSALAKKILSVGADVVCLQEVFPEDASYALYEALKDDYAHFYLAIGPRPLGFSQDALGFPSGLFVASKFPVESPRFTLFDASGCQINYGFFDFLVKSATAPLGHIFTTHLQSLNDAHFPLIRAQQLMQIIDWIQTDCQADPNTSIPRFVCGDFNIPWGSGEPGEKLIRTYFYDAYNCNRTEVRDEERTCTDYFSDRYFARIGHPQPIGANLQIIDYALLFKVPACSDCTLETILVPMNALSNPETALSDHHGLLSKLTLPLPE